MLLDLCCGESVAHSNISAKSDDGDEDWSSGPEVHAEGIQVLPALQTLQLSSSEGICTWLVLNTIALCIKQGL